MLLNIALNANEICNKRQMKIKVVLNLVFTLRNLKCLTHGFIIKNK